MAKNPLITDDIRQLIATVYLENLDYRAKEIKREVEIRLHKTNPRAKPDWPGLSAVQKELAKIRQKQVQSPDPLDEPWSLGCLTKYDMPPDALPIVIRIYERRLRKFEQHFAIREALWIGRLYKVICDPTVLERFASAYALREKIDWILNSPVDTRDLDITVIRYRNKQITEADVAKFPGIIRSLRAWSSEEEEKIKKKLKQKGYNIITPEEKLLREHVEQLWQSLPTELRKKMEQNRKKLEAKEAQNEGTHTQEG